MVLSDDGRLTVVSDLQFMNVRSPIAATPSGIVMLFRPLAPNAPFPILVTVSGIEIPVNPLHPLNAKLLIVVTEDGIIKLDSEESP